MNWMPDRNRLQPIHKQIEQHIKDKIKRGEWPLGHRNGELRGETEVVF
ncbi:hypothetical protein [Terrilactibacillus laevilacticus]|uniref:Uncharacterized protein n=1 Tax=Terrilactibacillus laevilacticus TaxID=1380157 RepID=A0ABW5PLM8_9BACI|nr:hypothetical protein [Terrilactibacillus laevilacticus]